MYFAVSHVLPKPRHLLDVETYGEWVSAQSVNFYADQLV